MASDQKELKELAETLRREASQIKERADKITIEPNSKDAEHEASQRELDKALAKLDRISKQAS